MTEQNSHGGVRRGAVTSTGHEGFQAFGPLEALYSENVPAKAVKSVRARSVHGDLLRRALATIGEKAAIAGRYIWKGYPRKAYAKTDGHYLPGGGIGGENLDLADLNIGGYSPKSAKQSWLRYITDNLNKFVYGAALTHGKDRGVYVDKNLFERAIEYTDNFARGLEKEAEKTAGYFVEAAKTIFHEFGHLYEGIKNEFLAETYANEVLDGLAERFDNVRFALKTVYGRNQPQPVAVRNRGWTR